jgi:hypothetical protein
MLNNFFSVSRAVNEIMWKNMVQSDSTQVTILAQPQNCPLLRLS